MNDYQTLRVALEEKLGLLQHRLGKITHDLRQAAEPDSEERATGRENDEVLEYLDNTGREELEQLQAAIARIDAGTYGICTQCGEEISDQRLAALPYTMTCITCAR
ncbi:MAG: TraR/DksA family transcriptional regulator [Deltaproteobacteria bacterium]|nr:TraR/DksA family transcriptional regulator [Deltaproteobacteria bacterium]